MSRGWGLESLGVEHGERCPLDLAETLSGSVMMRRRKAVWQCIHCSVWK